MIEQPEKTHDKPMQMEIKLNETGTKASIKIDGVDVTRRCHRLELVAEAGGRTTVALYYHAVQVKVLGTAWIGHKVLTLDPDTAQEAG